MHDEIFHFEIFKNFTKILKYFKTPFLKYFMKLLIFNFKWLKTFKNMIKVYQVSRRYIMLLMHNNKYWPITDILTLFQWTIHNTAYISGKICDDDVDENSTQYHLDKLNDNDDETDVCLYCAATVAAVDLLLTQLVNCPVELNGHCETCVSVIHMHCSHYCDFASVEVVIKNYLLTYLLVC